MQQQQYSKEFGGTAACTFRLVEETLHAGSKWETRKQAQETNKKELFGGDSWFSSVPVAEGLAKRGHEYVGAMKTNHALYPKDEIELIMKNWPSGSYIVFQCVTPGGHTLIGTGYKYNARKVLCFISTKNAGSTKPGVPYVAKFNDGAGNVCERSVPRPAVLSKYFSKCNGIDSHNQGRQGILALEKRWVTQDPWFRMATTLFGMTVTDCWKAYTYALPDQHPKKHIKLVEFSDRMTYDLIHNKYSSDRGGGSLLEMTIEVDTAQAVEQQAVVSPLSAVSSLEDIMESHAFENNTETEPTPTGRRPKRRTCNHKGCKKATAKTCKHYRCKLRSYNVNGKDVFGYFYCDEHKHHHWMDAVAGRIES